MLVDEPGAGGVLSDRVAWADRNDVGVVVGCALVDPTMRAMLVVVVDVLDEQRFDLAFVPDDRAIKEHLSTRLRGKPLLPRLRLLRLPMARDLRFGPLHCGAFVMWVIAPALLVGLPLWIWIRRCRSNREITEGSI